MGLSWAILLLVSLVLVNLPVGAAGPGQSQHGLIYIPGIDAGYWLGHLEFLPRGFSSFRNMDKFP